MNTETEKNVNEAIDWLQQVGGSVQDFAVEQAPLYCREVVAWVLWESSILAFASLLGVIAIGWIVTKSIRELRNNGDPCWVFGVTFGVAGLAGCIAGLTINTTTAVKAAVAPRLVIVEHLRGLK